jgi:hypothetical protein
MDGHDRVVPHPRLSGLFSNQSASALQLPRREIAARLGIQPWAATYRLDRAIELKFVEKVGG